MYQKAASRFLRAECSYGPVSLVGTGWDRINSVGLVIVGGRAWLISAHEIADGGSIEVRWIRLGLIVVGWWQSLVDTSSYAKQKGLKLQKYN